jgi:hypothetical protein
MSRPVRSLMSWDDTSPTDRDGRVIWWARLPGGQLVEVHHTGPYRARLRRWEDRGTGRLLQDEPVRLPHDNRHPPSAEQIRDWRRRALTTPDLEGSSE